MKKKIYKFFYRTKLISIAACVIASTFLLSGCSLKEQLKSSLQQGVGIFTPAVNQKVTSISKDKYAYQQLTSSQQKVYDLLLNAFLEYDSSVTIPKTSEDEVEKVFYAILSDYGGLFWVNGYEYQNISVAGMDTGRICPTYTMSKKDKENYQSQVDAVVEQWLSNLSADASDYEKAKYVYNLLVSNVDYDANSEENQNILSVFLHQKTVCQGYANAVSYLLDLLGIESTVVRGSANNEAHAWNLVKLDGQYYFYDVTWGNSLYYKGAAFENKIINYAYMNTTSEEMSMTHTLEMDIPIPECTATEDNYYYKEGLYFDSFDPRAIGQAISSAYKSGADSIGIKCANATIYAQLKSYFLDEYHIADACPNMTSIYYMDCEDMGVITFYL